MGRRRGLSLIDELEDELAEYIFCMQREPICYGEPIDVGVGPELWESSELVTNESERRSSRSGFERLKRTRSGK